MFIVNQRMQALCPLISEQFNFLAQWKKYIEVKIEDIFMLLVLSDYISFEKLFYIEQY